MAIRQQDIGPTVVVKIQKRRAPAQEARVAPQARLKGLVLEEIVAQVPVKAGRVPGEIRLHDIQ